MTQATLANLRATEIIDRLQAKSVVDSDSGCWIWQASTRANGYPRISLADEQSGHRAAYVALKGPIPDGLQIDHVCHNRDANCDGGLSCIHRRCVNPDHLEAVPSRTNTLRSSNSIAGINSRRTECKWGHAFDEENTAISIGSNGQRWRRCRKCAARRRSAPRTPVQDAA